MTVTQLQRLIDKAGLTQRAAAIAIGIGERHMRRLVAGDAEISRTIELAVRYVCERQPDQGAAK